MNKHYESLIRRQKVLGQVTAVDDFLIKAKGLQPIQLDALVMFEDGSKGLVRQVEADSVTLLHMGTEPLRVGMGAALQHHELVTKVGADYRGRVINVRGEPLDGGDPIAPDGIWPVFNQAPDLIDRQELDTQLNTGVTLVDTMFPLVLGQRLAVLGDSKSGKSSFLTQLTVNQKGTDRTVIYCLIAKRKTDIDQLLATLEVNDARENTIIIVATMFDSLVSNYLVPYIAAAMAEYFWQELDQDTIVIYDDLTSHAQVYREISLISGTSPGRDSYPGDMFFAHSSLLERAGRISRSGKTLTALPAVLVPGGDISTYLPTNVMSITDGQLIFDLELFRSGMRPAISTSLSVSRVGGRGQTKTHKRIASRLRKALASYYEANEFSHFGSELALESRGDIEIGKRVLSIMNQAPGESASVVAQQVMLEVALSVDSNTKLDIDKLKKAAIKRAEQVDNDNSFKATVQLAAQEAQIEVKK